MPAVFVGIAVAIMCLTIWTVTSGRVDTANSISHGRYLEDLQQDALLQISQVVRYSYDTARLNAPGVCPANHTLKTVNGTNLCWPNSAGACVQLSDSFNICIANLQDSNNLVLPPLSGPSPVTLTPEGVRVRRPSCTNPGDPCPSCTSGGTDCFTIVFCTGNGVDGTCTNAKKLWQTYATRL